MADPKAKAAEKEQPKEDLIEVNIAKGKRVQHKGDECPEGSKVVVSKDDAKWMLKRKLIEG